MIDNKDQQHTSPAYIMSTINLLEDVKKSLLGYLEDKENCKGLDPISHKMDSLRVKINPYLQYKWIPVTL